jgi:hypothetical protein
MCYTHIALCVTGASRRVTSLLSVNIVMAFHCSRNKIYFNTSFHSEIQHKLLPFHNFILCCICVSSYLPTYFQIACQFKPVIVYMFIKQISTNNEIVICRKALISKILMCESRNQ